MRTFEDIVISYRYLFIYLYRNNIHLRLLILIFFILQTLLFVRAQDQNKVPAENKYLHYQKLLQLEGDSARCTELISYATKICDSLSDYNFALLVFEKANTLLQQKNFRALMPALYIKWGYCQHLKGDYEAAEKLYSNALKCTDILDVEPLLKAELLKKAGLNLEKLGVYERALTCYNEALELYTKLNDEDGKVRVYSNMGLVFTLTEHYTQADEFFNKAARICLEKKWEDRYAVVLANKALVKMRLKKRKDAKSLFLTVLHLDLRKNIKVYINTCFNVGVLYSDLDKWDSCFYFLNKGKAISDSLNMSQQYDGHYYLTMGKCYADRNDIQKAILYHKLALKNRAGITNHNYRIMYDNISGFYFKLKKYDSALYYKKEIVRIMDSIHKSEIKEHVGFENKKVELLEKDYHNQIKAAGQEHFLSHLKKRNFQLFCTVIVLIVFMLLFLLYFKQYRLKLKKERLQGDLDFLKAQLNPNFLFNSLNNIYVLLDQDKNKALTLLVQFCELLRHQLYDCHVSSILLSEELRFLENYVDFEKLRYEGKITVEHNLRETEAGDLYIAPIVLQPFIENTFKQSPKSRQFPGHISIRSAVIENNFFMEVKNLVGAKEKPELPGGVELENAKKRLNLLYPGKHELKISATDTSLEVQLKITLSEN